MTFDSELKITYVQKIIMLTLILSSLPINSVKTLLTSSFVFVFLKSLLGFLSPCYKTNKIQGSQSSQKDLLENRAHTKNSEPFLKGFQGFVKDHI